jgi:hypothetical protein
MNEMSDMVVTASCTQRFTQEDGQDHILIDARAGACCDDLAIVIHNEMRHAGLLKFADPADDVPYSATGSAHRAQMESVAKAILEGIEIKVEMEQLE